MNLKTISRNVGYALLVDALFMFIAAMISLFEGNDSALGATTISFIITFIFGAFPFIFVRKTNRVTLREGYVIVTLSWILSFVFGMLPYALYGEPFTLENAWFESVSGFTTTGATVLEDVEVLPDSLLFWRSATHFIGGLGVVVFLLLIIPESSPIRMRLTNMEVSTLSRESYSSRTNKTVFIFAYVYLALVALSFVLYMLGGMSAFDAINHAFSVSATGGFSTRTASIAAYDSRYIEAVTMVFMVLSSIHFGLIFLAVTRHSLRPLANPVIKFYLSMLLIVTVLAAIPLCTSGTEGSFGSALWVSAFQTISTASTTGFAIADNSAWPLSANILLMFAAVTCGCAGSTTGGLKSDRVMILFKAIGCRIRHTLNPSVIDEVKVGGRHVRGEEVAPHVTYIALFGVILAVSVLLCAVSGASPTDSFSGSLFCLTNVGPAIGDIGSFGNYSQVPSLSKFVFTLDMFLGRVEIYPVLAVLAMAFARNRK